MLPVMTLSGLLIFGPDSFLIPSMIVIMAALLIRMRKEVAHD